MKPDPKKLARLAKVLTPDGTGIASELDSIEEKVDKVKETTNQLEADLTVISEAQGLLENEVKQQSSDIDQLKENKLSRSDLESLRPTLKGDKGDPGIDGTDGVDGKDGTSVDEVAVVKNIKENLSDFGNVFRDGLELLEGEERLDKSAIKGLEDYEETYKMARRPFNSGGGLARGVADDLYAPISVLTTYLKLDQTTPQTVTASPILNWLTASRFVTTDANKKLTSFNLFGTANTWTAIQAFNGGTSGVSAPFTVDSTQVVTNLNADLWDGFQFADYLNQAVKTTSDPTFNTVNVPISVGAGYKINGTLMLQAIDAQHWELSDFVYGDSSTNRLGIGVSDPQHPLHVGGSSDTGIASFSGTGQGGGTVIFRALDSTGWSGMNVYDENNKLSASFQYGNADTSVFTDQLVFAGRKSTTPITFWTEEKGLVERMRITPAGFVGIGTDNPGTKLDVIGTVTADAVTIGRAEAATDYALTFNGESNDGTLTWMEDENWFTTNRPIHGSTSLYRRYYHIVLGAANPGASGATWVDAGANTTGGWRLTNAAWLLRGQGDIHADWDGASDMTVGVNFMVNINNTGGAVGDTVDLKLTAYYKGVGDTATKSQVVEVPTTVGQSPQYKQFRATFTLDWDAVSNVIEVGDIIALVLNLETDTSEVDDIVVTSMEFSYQTTHSAIESGDI